MPRLFPVNSATWYWTTVLVLLIPIFVFATLFSLIQDFQAIPYNVRELLGEKHTWLRAFGASATILWVFGMPYFVLNDQMLSKKKGGTRQHNYTSTIEAMFIHTACAWLLVWVSFPTESIHDIIGAPLWERFVFVEHTLRYFPLFLLVSASLFGASILSLSATANHELDLIRLRNLMLVALPISFIGVIVFASTDNLIELLQYQGRSWRVIIIPIYLILLFSSALLISTINSSWRSKLLIPLVLFVASGPIGYLLLQQVFESQIFKYGKVFSAFQFLLSSDRNNYIEPANLFIRFCLAHYLLLCIIYFAQWHHWHRLLRPLGRIISK